MASTAWIPFCLDSDTASSLVIRGGGGGGRASGSKNILGLLSSEDRDSTGLTSAVSVALGKTVMIGL